MNEFTAKNKALHNALQEIFPAYIMASQDDDHTSVHVKGKATDLLYLTNQLVQSIRKEFRKEYEELYSSFCKHKQREASISVKRHKTS